MAGAFWRGTGTPPSDAALVRRVGRGDAVAFDMLVERYLRAVYVVAHAEVGASADAASVCEEAFLAVIERWEECRDSAHFPAWLLMVTRSLAGRVVAERRNQQAADRRLEGRDCEAGRINL